jgi:XTP/dITP diphosphohydrolase
MKIFVATTNNDKYDEISGVLKVYNIETEHFMLDLREEDDSLEKIVRSKALQAFEKIKKPVITDDTGIFFEAYENFPGHRAKRVFCKIGYKGLLKKLKGKNRKAFFKSVICYTDGSVIKSFKGIIKGTITDSVKENSRKKFPYDSLFIPEGFSSTLSEIPWEKRIKLSHRSKAVQAFARWFSHRL